MFWSLCSQIVLGLIILVTVTSCQRKSGPDQDQDSAELQAEEEKVAASPASTSLSAFANRLQQEFAREQPEVDGWETEAFRESAKKQLKELAHLLEGNKLTAELLGPVFSTNATSTSMLPRSDRLKTVYENNGTSVSQLKEAAGISSEPKGSLLEALEPLAQALADLGHPHYKFKIYRVAKAPEHVDTKILLLADGHDDSGNSRQINSRWHIAWTEQEDGPPLIKKVTLESFEQVDLVLNAPRLFTDRAAALLPKGQDVTQQLSSGLMRWTRQLDKDTGVSTNGYLGLSVGDLDGDGLDDLYVAQTGGLPNRLLLRNPDGSLRDVTAGSGAAWLNDSRASLIADFDNDGDNDLVVNIPNAIVFMENDGKAHFTRRFVTRAGGSPFGLAAADPDRDGLLDLYVCGYGSVWGGGLGDYKHHIPIPMHDAQNGGGNVFLKNEGNFHFVDVTKDVGLDQNNTRWSLSAAWEDYDGDGDLDLYVANDFGRNNLYRNDSGEKGRLFFTDVAAASGAEDLSPSMSANWGDPNNDGKPDLYVSNMFSGAGNRITTQPQFMKAARQETRDNFLRMSRGNTMLINEKENLFADTSEQSGITVGRWAWASTFADINNDGWQDILIANGFMTGEDPADL